MIISGNTGAPDCPRFSRNQEVDGCYIFSATISKELCVLDGHFPANPIVPAYAQIEWVAGLVKEFAPSWDRIVFRSMKFLRPLRVVAEVPTYIAVVVDVQLTEGETGGAPDSLLRSCTFTIRSPITLHHDEDRVYTKGVCSLVP